jgi:COPI associated protein
MADSNTPLIGTQAATAAATTGVSFLNAAGAKIIQARDEGPLTFRMLGFIGGLAMIVSNGLAILERFFSFNFAGSLIAVYGVFFGVIIVMLEGPVPCKERMQSGIRYYAKFLEFTWGRGALYFFVGTLQVSNVNMLDWVVGGFMIFVGITAMGVGIAAARDLRLLKFSVADEAKLKEKFAAHDSDGTGTLDVKELTAFVRDAGVEMNRNEIAATFLGLGKTRAIDDCDPFDRSTSSHSARSYRFVALS